MKYGKAIRKFRQERKMTQKELGNALGVSAQMIAQYETGKRNPKFETLAKIAMALNVSVSDLLGWGKMGMSKEGEWWK